MRVVEAMTAFRFHLFSDAILFQCYSGVLHIESRVMITRNLYYLYESISSLNMVHYRSFVLQILVLST